MVKKREADKLAAFMNRGTKRSTCSITGQTQDQYGPDTMWAKDEAHEVYCEVEVLHWHTTGAIVAFVNTGVIRLVNISEMRRGLRPQTKLRPDAGPVWA